MERCYCGATALERAVETVLGFYGLEVDFPAASRRPAPALTFADNARRIDLGSAVLAEVRRQMPVSEADRRAIYRWVDSACARSEEAERRASRNPVYARATARAVALFAAKGGGALGSFERWVYAYPSDALLLEPASAEAVADPVAAPVVGRQDVRPMPTTTNPRPRTNPPGTAAPATTNPTTRAIRVRRGTRPERRVAR